MADLNIQKSKNKTLLGLKDRGCKIIKCDNCSKDLMVFQITKNNQDLINEGNKPVFTRVMVLCCLCDNESKVETIEGQFYTGAPNDKMGFEPIEKYSGVREADIYFSAWESK